MRPQDATALNGQGREGGKKNVGMSWMLELGDERMDGDRKHELSKWCIYKMEDRKRQGKKRENEERRVEVDAGSGG